MNEFSGGFWSPFIAIVSLLGIAAMVWLLVSQRGKREPGKADLVGHVWDETLAEYNNPLPRWWFWLFVITIVFGLGYLLLYPGLGSFAGVGNWSSTGQHEREVAAAKERFGPIYDKFMAQDVAAVASDPAARQIGQRLFLNFCAQCHASDGRGGNGFPNLADTDWLFGGAPEQIATSITSGRKGTMPPFGEALGEQGVGDVANYVASISGQTHDAARAARGKATFDGVCTACHGADGKGNPALGAPNLTDAIWLYGGGTNDLALTISKGRSGTMPAWGEILDPAKRHLLTAYVYGLATSR
jgi:cytochrome c oxidase cbb3-type subunit 3